MGTVWYCLLQLFYVHKNISFFLSRLRHRFLSPSPQGSPGLTPTPPPSQPDRLSEVTPGNVPWKSCQGSKLDTYGPNSPNNRFNSRLHHILFFLTPPSSMSFYPRILTNPLNPLSMRYFWSEPSCLLVPSIGRRGTAKQIPYVFFAPSFLVLGFELDPGERFPGGGARCVQVTAPRIPPF